MPKRAQELTAIELKRLKPGVHAVGGVAGLHLQVAGGSGRSWLLRTMVGTKRREIGLGAYPEIGLAAARQKAAELKELVRRGIDPVELRKTARQELFAAQKRGLLFSEAVDVFEPLKQAELSDGKYRKQWRDSIDKYAIPLIGQMMVHDITLQDILRTIEPIWLTKTVTADKLRRKLNEILDYAFVKGDRSGPNPARWEGNLSMVLPSPSGIGGDENYPSLQLNDVARFWSALNKHKGMGAAALRFQTMTATRAGAIRFMSWREIDLKTRLWTVQPGRLMSKIGRRDSPKRVPLTDEMVAFLEVLPRQADSDLIFWAARGGPISDATMAKLMRTIHDAALRAGEKGFVDVKTGSVAVPHGIRSTFKVWATEHTDYDWSLSEAALWHKLGNKVEQAYARTDMVERRRAMMTDWASYLNSTSNNLSVI